MECISAQEINREGAENRTQGPKFHLKHLNKLFLGVCAKLFYSFSSAYLGNRFLLIL